MEDGELDWARRRHKHWLLTPSEVGTDDRLEAMPSDRDELEQMERAERMTHLGRGRGPDDTPFLTGRDGRRP